MGSAARTSDVLLARKTEKGDETKRMKIESLHPGVELATVVEKTGFELLIPDEIPTTTAPTPEQVELIRGRIDPNGMLLEAKVQ